MIVIIIVIIWIESKFKSKPLAYRIFEQIPLFLVKWYDRKNPRHLLHKTIWHG